MKTKIKLMALVAGLMSVLPMTSAWAYSVDFYAKLTAKVATDSTGLGKVYVESGTPGESCTGTAKASVSYGYGESKPSSGSVPVKAYVEYDKDTVSFLGWSTTGNKDDIALTAETYSVTKTASGTSETSATDAGTVYAHFKTITLDPFSIAFSQNGGGSYTANGGAAENLSGLTAATPVTLASTDPNFFCWKVNGQTFTDNPYTVTCKADTAIVVEFLTDANVVQVGDAEQLAEVSTYEEIKKIIIPANTNVYLERGVSVTIPQDKMLTVDGNLFVEGSLAGTITGKGKVSKCTTFIQQTGVDGQCGPEAIPFASWPALGVIYWKTTTDAYLATVTGKCSTPDGVLEHVKLVNGKGGIVRSKQEKRTSTVFYAGVNTAVAMNHITSIGSQADIATIYSSNNSGTFKLLTATTTYNGDNGGKYTHNWGVTECAGNALTIAQELGGGSGFKLINGSVTISGKVQATDTYFINCTRAKASSYHSDKTKNQAFRFFETTGIDITTSMATGGDGARFYSGKYDVTLKGTTNWNVEGGAFKNDPNDYLADKVNYEAKQRPEDNYWVVVPKAPAEYPVTVGDAKYTTLEEAIANTTTGTLKLQGHVSLLKPVEISADQSLTIELEGYKITGDSGVFVNRGTLVINDGSNNDAPSYVMAEGGYLFDNYGTLEITCGYYSGQVRLNAGNFITHGGTFNVTMEAGAGVTDKAAVADIRGGVFKTDSNVATESEVICASTQYTGGFLDAGFVAVPYEGALWIGCDQYAICQEISLSGAEKAWRLTAIPSSDQELYIRNPATRADCKDDAEWRRFQEVTTWIKPYSTKCIDCVLEFDRDIAASSLTAVVSFLPQTLDEAIPANTLYSALIPRITAYQIAYSRFINDSDWNLLDCGIKNNSLDNIGTTCNIYMYLCNQNRDKLVDLKWTYTYSNFRPIAKCTYKFTGKGAICGDTDYDSLVAALAAVSDGGTVKLSKDCGEDVTIAKSCTVDLNGFAFTGSFVKGDGVEETVEGDVHTFVATAPAKPPVVAKVGDVEYGSLQGAINAAKYATKDADGNVTVVLLQDVNEQVVLAPGVIIDKNGFALDNDNVSAAQNYSVDPDGDILRVSVGYEALVDGIVYSTIDAAIEAVKDGGTIKVAKNCTATVKVAHECVVNLAGFVVTDLAADEEKGFRMDVSGDVCTVTHPYVARVEDVEFESLSEAIDAVVAMGVSDAVEVVLEKDVDEDVVVGAACKFELTGDYEFTGTIAAHADDKDLSVSRNGMTWTVVAAQTMPLTDTAAVKVGSDVFAAFKEGLGEDVEVTDDEVREAIAGAIEAALEETPQDRIGEGLAKVGTDAVSQLKTIDVEIDKDTDKAKLSTGLYQPTKIVEIEVGEGVTKQVSVLNEDPGVKPDALITTVSKRTSLILAVPGNHVNVGGVSVPVTVANVIASKPSENDTIALWKQVGGETVGYSWSWHGTDWVANKATRKDADGNEIVTDEDSPASNEAGVLAVGMAFRYERLSGRTDPVTVVAQFDETEEVSTTVQEDGWNVVANPNVNQPFDLTAIKPEADTLDAKKNLEKDQIVVPMGDVGDRVYTYKANEGWGYEASETRKVGTLTIVRKVRKTDNLKVDSGKGFWYFSGGTKPTINWRKKASAQ